MARLEERLAAAEDRAVDAVAGGVGTEAALFDELARAKSATTEAELKARRVPPPFFPLVSLSCAESVVVSPQ